MKKIYIAFTTFLFCWFGAEAQNVGINHTSPHPAAALDIKAIGTQGFLPPRLTGNSNSTFGFSDPSAAGLMYYDSTAQLYRFYAGTGGWKTFGNSELTGTGADGRIAFWNGTTSLSYSPYFVWDQVNSRLGVGTAVPQVSLDVTGGFATRQGVTASPTADVDGYNPGNNSFIAFNGTSSFALKGIVAGKDGQHLILHNTSSFQFIIQEEASATPANSIRTGTGNFIVSSHTSIHLIYNATANRWLLLSSSAKDNMGNHMAEQNIVLGKHFLSGDGGNEGVFVDPDGKVGIGTSAPSATLEINGKVGIPATAAYAYTSPKKMYYSIPAIEFMTRPTNINSDINSKLEQYVSSGGSGSMYASLHLPDNAVIDEIKVFLFDNMDSHSARATLVVYDFGTANTDEFASNLSGVKPGNTSVIIDKAVTIDNANKSYSLKIDFEKAGDDLRVRGARVIYSVTQVD